MSTRTRTITVPSGCSAEELAQLRRNLSDMTEDKRAALLASRTSRLQELRARLDQRLADGEIEAYWLVDDDTLPFVMYGEYPPGWGYLIDDVDGKLQAKLDAEQDRAGIKTCWDFANHLRSLSDDELKALGIPSDSIGKLRSRGPAVEPVWCFECHSYRCSCDEAA